MRLLPTVTSIFTVIFNQIDSISQFECLPNGDPTPGFLPGMPLNFPGRSSTAIPHSEALPSLQIRSQSPPAIRIASRLGGLKIEKLRYLRLIPHTNPSQRFEIRKYTFPQGASLQVRGKSQILAPILTGEQNVLSTSDGDIFAIVEGNNTFLRGIYTMINNAQKRAKINMNTGKVTMMTTDEIQETPLTKANPISRNFLVKIKYD